jgi:hypothetical protein
MRAQPVRPSRVSFYTQGQGQTKHSWCIDNTSYITSAKWKLRSGHCLHFSMLCHNSKFTQDFNMLCVLALINALACFRVWSLEGRGNFSWFFSYQYNTMTCLQFESLWVSQASYFKTSTRNCQLKIYLVMWALSTCLRKTLESGYILSIQLKLETQMLI